MSHVFQDKKGCIPGPENGNASLFCFTLVKLALHLVHLYDFRVDKGREAPQGSIYTDRNYTHNKINLTSKLGVFEKLLFVLFIM